MAENNSDTEEFTMGFKDKQKALDTLKALDGRDIVYQRGVITNFISRAKKTIGNTKNESKLTNLQEALQVFEDWMKDYKTKDRAKENFGYLELKTVAAFRPLAKEYGILDDTFYLAYKKVKGEYKDLRKAKTPDGKTTWDIERNIRLKSIVQKIREEHVQWYETDVGKFRGLPTKEHVRCIQLGYGSDSARLRKLMAQVKEDFDEMSEPEDMEVDEKSYETRKRKHDRDDSSESEEESDEPEKKSAKTDEGVEKTRKDDNKVKPCKEEKEEGGLSFKTKEKALQSLKSLEGRDVAYQYHAITGLVRRAERVLTLTKDEEKIKNMKEAIATYENWITDYNVNGRSKENFAYLPIDVLRAYKPLADKYGLDDTGFLKAYEDVDGDYKRLRSVKVCDSDKLTWDIERNNNLRPIVEEIKKKGVSWFQTEGEFSALPTKEHTQCILWGFSPDTAKIKKLIPKLTEQLDSSG